MKRSDTNSFWRSLRRSFAILAVAAGLLQVSLGQGALTEYPELSVTVQDDSITGPDTLEAGFYSFAVVNESSLEPDVSVARLAEGVTVDEVIAALEEVNTAFAGEGNPGQAMAMIDEMIDLVGGQGMPEGGAFELTPGEYLIVSVSAEDQGPSHTSLGLYTTLSVTESASPPEPPQADVTVQMVDFAFALPPDITPGMQTWEVVNVGGQIHHMVLLRAQEGSSMEDLMSYLQNPEPAGPPPAEEVAYVNVLSTDSSNYLTFDLTPGDYVAICFMPDYETGQPHFMLGMMQPFSVPAN